jgi:hypothetical protein
MKEVTFKQHNYEFHLNCEILSQVESFGNISFKLKTFDMAAVALHQKDFANSTLLKIVDEWYDIYKIKNIEINTVTNFALITINCIKPEMNEIEE